MVITINIDAPPKVYRAPYCAPDVVREQETVNVVIAGDCVPTHHVPIRYAPCVYPPPGYPGREQHWIR